MAEVASAPADAAPRPAGAA